MRTFLPVSSSTVLICYKTNASLQHETPNLFSAVAAVLAIYQNTARWEVYVQRDTVADVCLLLYRYCRDGGGMTFEVGRRIGQVTERSIPL